MLRSIFALLLILTLCACQGFTRRDQNHEMSTTERQQPSQQFAALVTQYDQFLLTSPTQRNRLDASAQFTWDNLSKESQQQRLQFYQNLQQELQAIDPNTLDFITTLSYHSLRTEVEFQLASNPWRAWQISRHPDAWSTRLADSLIYHHRVDSIQDVQNYLQRLADLPASFKDWQDSLNSANANGLRAPHFVYRQSEERIRAMITGEPFTQQGVSPLWEDFVKKLDALQLYPSTQRLLERKAKNILLTKVKPAYQNLLAFSQAQTQLQENSQPAIALPYYQILLRHYSDSDLDALSIQEFGKYEVARLHHEIRKLLPKLGFQDEDIAVAFQKVDRLENHLDTDQLLQFQQDLLNNLANTLPNLVAQLPTAKLAIAVSQPYHSAFSYQAPALDGSRPGLYFVDLAALANRSEASLAALSFTQALAPHLQAASAQENTNLPLFLRLATNPAFNDGWALYISQLAATVGAYKSAEEEYQALIQELEQAVALVLDPAIHTQGLSLDQAVAYLQANTPLNQQQSLALAQFYLANPAQAVAASMGKWRLLSIRQQIQNKMGSRFELNKFHRALLIQGALPMDQLEQWMHFWADNELKKS